MPPPDSPGAGGSLVNKSKFRRFIPLEATYNSTANKGKIAIVRQAPARIVMPILKIVRGLL